MALARPSMARDAALQAEFNEKKWVWVPDDRDGYLAGWVTAEDDEFANVIIAANSEHRRVNLDELSKMNPPKFDRVEDMADLTFLNEASVVHNLHLRYGSDAIYTYSGLFLVAMNPYKQLPNLYSDKSVAQYRGRRRDENAPHIFAIAERAWVSMGEERENQSILITGESGAGKTENTKKVIQYLAAIATDSATDFQHFPHSRSGSISVVVPAQGLPRSTSFRAPSATPQQSTPSTKAQLGLLERQILQANPILEAFGNAQTQRNNNSSRFGKFVRIEFAGDGSIAGANIDWYLLEKSRVVFRSDAERSFHVFYQLLDGAGPLKDALLLDGGVDAFRFLNASRATIDGVDDRAEWRLLQSALDTVGFTQAEQFDLFRVLAAILHIGNIELSSDRSGENARFKVPAQAEKACHLLGVSAADFGKAVLAPRVLAGRDWVTQSRTAHQARDELDSLCKTLYEKTFGALVERVNRALARPASKSTFIGVLDIAGFEIFQENGFEQLCINYTNERLQQYFNHHMFVLEQDEYAREGIEWQFVNFGLDLQPTIDLIEESGGSAGRPGILSCLDEECIMPKATDATFTAKLHALWTNTDHLGATKYAPARFAQGFVVAHYAGRVEYRTEGWLAKNKDPLNDNLTRVMGASSERFVSALFAEGDGVKRVGGVVVKKGAFRTVTQRHKEQLSNLMTQLAATRPHFVRCIVPNGARRPGRVDVPLVLDQLRCNGVLEGIRIARLGYPNRLPFVEFRGRYEVLVPGVLPSGYMDGRTAASRILAALEMDTSHFRIGLTKVFFKAGVLAELEERRDGLLYGIFARLQAVARKYVARRQIRKILGRAVAARRIQTNARLYGELREWGWWQLYTKVRPLLAATRNDDELRRKSLELEMAKERAERDARERETLATLKMELEADKRRVEEALAAEQLQSTDREAMLQRTLNEKANLQDDVLALQADLDTVDGQLERVQAQLAEEMERYKALRAQLAVAAEALEKWEGEAEAWAARSADYALADERVVLLEAETAALAKELQELRAAVAERDEDKARLKERMESLMSDFESRLSSEIAQRDTARAKVDAVDKEARQAKEELAELTRTATDYAGMIARKDADIVRAGSEVATLRREREAAIKQTTDLQTQFAAAQRELVVHKGEAERTRRLQVELDELRAAMDAKSSEDHKRSEAERSREIELADLRSQVSRVTRELADARKSTVSDEAALRSITRERDELLSGQSLLTKRVEEAEKKAMDVDGLLGAAEKARRTADNELTALRMRQGDLDTQLADSVKAKESAERQLANAHAKHQDFEDALLQVEREKASWTRQIEAMRKELEAETVKRTQLEKATSKHNSESSKTKDQIVKLERDLKKARDDLHHRDWDIQQLRSKQDKTIVEHVHVLEEAKRLTDQQLAETQTELRAAQSQLRSLQQVKTRLLTDSEDSAREAEKERALNRSKDKQIRQAEEKTNQLRAEIEKERRMREGAETQGRRTEADTKVLVAQAKDLSQQLANAVRAKQSLEAELASIATDGDHQNAMNKMRRQYDARIAQLESMVEDADMARTIAERIKQRVDSQHSEIRKLLLSTGGSNPDPFRTRLLRELELAEQQMNAELSARDATPRRSKGDVRTFGNLAPSKRSSIDASGNFRLHKDALSEPPRTGLPEKSDRQVNQLRQQVQVLELQMLASDRVRQHLEASLRDMTSDIENSDGSAQSLHSYRAKLARENARLAELHQEEAQARRSSEASQMDGVKAMWSKFQSTMSQERESYSKLEESRKALLAQQRTTQTELEDQRRQVQELLQSRKQLQAQLADVTDRLELELVAKNDETAARRKLQGQLQELEVAENASSSVQSELHEAAALWKGKAESYLSRIEAAEIAKAKADRSEAQTRRVWEEAQRTLEDTGVERKAMETRLGELEQHIHELERKLEEDSREFSDMELFRQRLAEEMDDERHQYQKDLSERDFSIDQTRKKYQAELAQLSEEMLHEREKRSRLADENRKLKSEHDELQLRYDDEVYSGSAWKAEKGRLEAKVGDLVSAYDASNAANAEQQTQIVSLLSQVRELRAHLDEADAERAALQQARRTLEGRLADIAQDHLETSKMSSDRVVQALHLEKQDLRSALEEQMDKVVMANERVKKAESFANEYQVELSKIRAENSELDRTNASLGKQVKDLNVRIVDMETRAFAASSPRAPPATRRLESRIEELQSKLSQESKDKTDSIRQHRTSERDTKFQLVESERQRSRLEEKVQETEAQVGELRSVIDGLQTSESELQLAKRRAEREANDHRQRALHLERELERLRSRLERPSSVVLASPASSPRK